LAPDEVFRRTLVIGTSGSGKSTVAGRLAGILDVDHVELDSIFWTPGWTPVSGRELQTKVAEVAAKQSWVIDGNYSPAQELVWPRATAIGMHGEY